ncbi:hypothetical protein ACV8VY_20330 [Citrobacter freundii]|uniref:hypothetical protein n=1 Tax=Citrobacter TaxID=544 RepID=UPI00352DB277|nr:hypothetical protein [Citrobacter freundii]
MFNPLDDYKASKINPFHNANYQYPKYMPDHSQRYVSVMIDSREMEVSILAAYDYGIESLSEEGLEQLERLIADLKVVITGR